MTQEIIGQSKDHNTQMQEISVMRRMLDTMENHETRISNLEDTMRVNAVQETKLTEKVNRKIVGLLEGKSSNAYRDNHIRGKAYATINRDIRKRFGVRRKELPAKEFGNAIVYIDNWKLEDKELEQTIFNANHQTTLFEA